MSSSDTQFKKGRVPWSKGLKIPEDKKGGCPKKFFDIEKAKKLYYSGKSFSSIEKILGVSRNTLIRRFDSLGFKRRTKSEESKLYTNKSSYRKQRSRITKKFWKNNPEAKEKLRDLMNKRFLDPKERIKVSERMKSYYINSDKGINMMRKGRLAQVNIKTKPEVKVECLVKDLGFKYTGDARFYVGRFNPDFVNKERNLIIEVYGDYWHTLPRSKELDSRRLIKYKEKGFRTLVIWEHELQALDVVKYRIKEFINE